MNGDALKQHSAAEIVGQLGDVVRDEAKKGRKKAQEIRKANTVKVSKKEME